MTDIARPHDRQRPHDALPRVRHGRPGPARASPGCPLSYDDATGQGTYLMRMEPGAVTIAHDHAGMEEFLIIEGDLVDSDGTGFGPGDFVSYDAGTHHNSWTRARLPHRRLRMAADRGKARARRCR